MRTSPSPAPILGILTATLLTATLLAACGTSQPTTAPASAPPTSSPTASTATSGSPPPASSGACAGADLAATSTGWGGAAGSRGADVRVANSSAAACSIEGPAVAIVDESGSVLLEGDAGAQDGEVMLEPGGARTFSLLFSNWCDTTVTLPLHVVIEVGTDRVPIEGLPLESTDQFPPCNGEGQPPALSTIPWSPG